MWVVIAAVHAADGFHAAHADNGAQADGLHAVRAGLAADTWTAAHVARVEHAFTAVFPAPVAHITHLFFLGYRLCYFQIKPINTTTKNIDIKIAK